MATPIVYSPDLEHAEKNEAETTEKLAETLHEIREVTSKDYGHAVRSLHAKSHALLEGTLTVLPLAAPLAQGLFATPATYPAIARISTAPGDVLPDRISSPRGFALKVMNVPGERVTGGSLNGSGGSSQDFLMVDGPAFGVADARHFAPQLALLAKTTDRVEGLKKVLSTVLQALEGALEAVGTQSTTLSQLGGKRNTNPLGETFFSQTPYLYGAHIAKFSIAPVSENLLALRDKKIDVAGRENALREEVDGVTASGPAAWELRVQLCVDIDQMPIEDASKVWDEKLSPWQTVARLEIPAQPGWTEARSKQIDDGLAFDPWDALAAHRPLGSINRVRKSAYVPSAEFRATFNGCPVKH